MQFTSPLSLIPGWNSQATANMKEWALAIGGKVGGLFGSGATPGTMTLTTLSGDVTVGSTPELLREAGLGLIEKVATPAAAASSYVDLMAHYTCWAGANPGLAAIRNSGTGRSHGATAPTALNSFKTWKEPLRSEKFNQGLTGILGVRSS